MKTIKRLICLVQALIIFGTLFAQAEIFVLPKNIKRLESEALSGVPLNDGILLPETLEYIAEDAFEDTFVYGIYGGKAQQYAQSRDLNFIGLDITDISLDVPAYASPYRSFTIHVNAKSVLPYQAIVKLCKDGNVYFETEPFDGGVSEIILYEGGLYDYEVTVYNEYTKGQAFFEGETEIYEPVKLIGENLFVRPGESFCPIDETEERNVYLEYEGSALSINGSTITANEIGSYTVCAKTKEFDDIVYTYFTVNVVIAVENISFDTQYVTLYPDDVYSPLFTIAPSTANEYELEWSSSDPSVATVVENGAVKAISPGRCTIRLSAFDAEAVFSIFVKLPCEKVDIIQPNFGSTLNQGDIAKLSYTLTPFDTDDADVIWLSGDKSIIEVDAAGYIRAVSPGTTKISCISSANPEVFDEISLTVIKGVESISANIPEYMFVGDSITPDITIEPADVDANLTISISDTSVVKLVAGGELGAVGSGSAVITFRASDWTSVSYPITVYDRCESISSKVPTLYLNKGMSANLSDMLTYKPATSRINDSTFISFDESKVIVDSNGKLTAVDVGETYVAIICDSASYNLPIKVVADGNVISSVSVSPSYMVLLPGQTAALSPVISGADGKYKSGDWYSDNNEVVAIDGIASNGQVTIKALKQGSARIYIVSSSGLTAYCEVLVNPINLKSISIKQTEYSLNPGESIIISYSLSPQNAFDGDIYMYSTNTSVAEVSYDGIVKANGAGECDIFITNGEIAASCRIYVKANSMTEAWLCESEMRGNAGDSAEICYAYEPENASPALFNWISENSGVADVDAINGIVWFKSEGETFIHGSALDGSGLELDLRVVVDEIPVKTLTLSQDNITLYAGESFVMRYSVYPSNASFGEAVFESADDSIAKVDESGKISAVRAGNTEIFVTVGSGECEITQIVNVTVKRKTETRYRALIMGQFTVPGSKGYLPFSLNSTKGVYDALSLSTLDGAGYSIKYLPANPTVESVRSAISSLAQAADEDDVTFIYLLTHGSYTTAGGYYMQFANGGEYYANTIINDVSKISGHVVLVLCTCHSGRILSCSAMKKLISAGGEYAGNNGKGHLSVICSSTDTKSTYYNISNASQSYDFFSKAFTMGLGWNMLSDLRMNMSADQNGDGQISVSELSSYSGLQTQKLISFFVQQYGTGQLSGSVSQYPTRYIASGEENLIIYGR